MVASKAVEPCEIDGWVAGEDLPLLGLLRLSDQPGAEMKIAFVPSFVGCAVPVGRQALKVRVTFERQSWMAGG